MAYRTYLLIVIRIIAFAYSVQIIINTKWLESFLTNPVNAILPGLIVCAAEIFIIKTSLGNRFDLLWAPLTYRKILHALLAFLLVLTLTTVCVEKLDRHKVFAGVVDLPTYLLVLFLNLLPNALTEEWIFRFLPTVINHSNVLRAMLFYAGVTIIFMLVHLPKFYLDGHLGNLSQVFIAGVAFLLIYLLTRNLPFVTLVHAFTNKAWFVFESSGNWLFLYASIAVVSLCWGIGKFLLRRQLRAAR